ncbi:MAG: long-chain fatty acid--CoA ligase [Deltaproteobacteria bacterium]|nr:long-chain fatty acid--CoA ligase [Deltaproteobacteria bacterium]
MRGNLCSVLDDNLSIRGEKTAIVYRGGSDTFAGLHGKSLSVARALIARGLEPGEKVGLHLANIPEFVYAYFGILRAGGQVVPLNVMLKEGELAYLGNDSGVKFVITQAPFVENLLSARASMGSLKEIFCVSPHPGEILPFESLLGDQRECPLPETRPEDVAVIFYTSGTTGQPKGAMLTHENLYTNALVTAEAYGYVEEDFVVFGMPLFHSSGQTNVMNAGFSQGAAIYIMPRFSAEEAIDVVSEHHASVFVGVPTMYHQIINNPKSGEFAVESLRVLIVGAAPMPKVLYETVSERFGVPITEGYGLSEAGPVVAHNPIHGRKKIGSVGLSLPGISIRIVDEEDRDLPTCEVGELLVRGPNVMLGYLNRPKATAEALREGWLHTGDLAKVDEDGYLFIVDRKKDMVLTGGFNIYPREIEEILHQHPSVSEAAVIGLPDEEKGEIAVAFLILREGQGADEGEIIEFCRKRMAVYKAPRKVKFVKKLPRNSAGKVLKRLLRESIPLPEKDHHASKS